MNLDVVAEQGLKTRRERLNALCLHQLTQRVGVYWQPEAEVEELREAAP
jgi:hypothetical protein